VIPNGDLHGLIDVELRHPANLLFQARSKYSRHEFDSAPKSPLPWAFVLSNRTPRQGFSP